MKILHMNGFSESDLVNYRFLVYTNLIQSVIQLIEGGEALDLAMDSVEVQVIAYLSIDRI
jgi:hypothetical protein